MKFYIVDCFAEEKYQGNELLVVIPDRPVDDDEQQKIAREINFSETAFILSGKQGDGGYDVRIWTPNGGEVPFAGHPVLGTAFVIGNLMEETGSDIKLNLKIGQINVNRSFCGMTMNQKPPVFGERLDKCEIAEAYGLCDEDIRSDYPVQWVSTGLEAVVVPVRNRDVLRKIRMDKDKFCEYTARHPECYCNHLFFADLGDGIFSARCMMEDFVEDPATGSANGGLAAYLLEHDYFGSQDIHYAVYQGEDMGRPSTLHIHAAKENEQWTIEVGGNCHVVASGEWS